LAPHWVPPVPLINVYMAGDVLIDAGRSWDKRRILKQGLRADRGARETPRRLGRADMEMVESRHGG